MRAERLYIENFMCYDKSTIDFSLFNSALIIAKVANDDAKSNGAGKTTIFKAIEYALFNQSDGNLDEIIRDDTDFCKVVFDFSVEDKLYRVSRIRTKKGTTDLSLFERNGEIGDDDSIFNHETSKKFWKDISGRRTADTEKELNKIIKINYKSFGIFVHFMQNDFSGLTTATPEKRKALLKEPLNLVVYSKLEKIAKDTSNLILKDIDKSKMMIEALGNPNDDLNKFNSQLLDISTKLDKQNLLYKESAEIFDNENLKLKSFQDKKNNLEKQSIALIEPIKQLELAKNKIETSIKDFSNKKASLSKAAKELAQSISSLKEEYASLNLLDLSKFNEMELLLNNKKEQHLSLNVAIKNAQASYEELKIPMPLDNKCKHCRQELTEEHKKACQQQINNDLISLQKTINNNKALLPEISKEINNIQAQILNLLKNKQRLESISLEISSKNKEMKDKKLVYEEYNALLDKLNAELSEKISQLEDHKKSAKESSSSEIDILNRAITDLLEANNVHKKTVFNLMQDIEKLKNEQAVTSHLIELKTKDVEKSLKLKEHLVKLNEEYSIYPYVLQAFSSTGIPNAIIQNVLDDLQEESNLLLNQLKPGLQLQFLIEKTNSDGEDNDTLDIVYTINGKKRQYGQLSGAMKLAATFSLKLGLSFLLQKIMGIDIKFLLLDEIDQSLDKASIDAFADIIKFFQKDFKILVITHNDRLKDKIPNKILVSQNIDMISTAALIN